MQQKVEYIDIENLHLWTENPRDPIGEDISDLEIIKRAITDNNKKWNIPDLIKNMGSFYHFNKLPIVVNKNGEFIVYDGNCRIAILKYVQNPEWAGEIEGTLFPTGSPEDLVKLKTIPCNICDEETALQIIYHDNIRDNTRTPLIQSYFEHYHLIRPKDIFLMFEEATQLIGKNEKLNQRFVKEEVLTEVNLLTIGFKILDGKIYSVYDDQTSEEILKKLIELIDNGKISTRNSDTSTRITAGGLGDFMKKEDEKLNINEYNDTKGSESQISINAGEEFKKKNSATGSNPQPKRRKTQVTSNPDILFGRTLILKEGRVNNLYCAINDIYEKFKNQDNFEPKLDIIGMSLRLILDIAGREILSINTDKAYKPFIQQAKKDMHMSKEDKVFLNVTKSRLDEGENLEGICANYAHGNIPGDKANILKLSSIVGDILSYYFSR